MLVLFRSKPDPSLDQPAEVPIASQYTEYHSQADHNFDCIDLRAPEELGLRIRHALALHTLVLFFIFGGLFRALVVAGTPLQAEVRALRSSIRPQIAHLAQSSRFGRLFGHHKCPQKPTKNILLERNFSEPRVCRK